MPATREAGAIAFKNHQQPRFLLVGAKQASGQWIFPKGHVEPNETPGQAALRELKEEAGVEGKLLRRVGRLRFPYRGENVDVDYYLIEATGEGPSEEGRDRLWLPLDEALQRLTFDDARRLLASNRALLSEPRQRSRGRLRSR